MFETIGIPGGGKAFEDLTVFVLLPLVSLESPLTCMTTVRRWSGSTPKRQTIPTFNILATVPNSSPGGAFISLAYPQIEAD